MVFGGRHKEARSANPGMKMMLFSIPEHTAETQFVVPFFLSGLVLKCPLGAILERLG